MKNHNVTRTNIELNEARSHMACLMLGFSVRTYERWKKSSDKIDKRKGASKSTPNKLSDFKKKKDTFYIK